MKFTSEDLMKAMGLQIGDKIILDSGSVFEIKKRDCEILLHYLDGPRITNLSMCFEWFNLSYLCEENFEILPRPKRVGDLKCCDYKCTNCPIRIICNGEEIQKDLYEELEIFKKVTTKDRIFDQEIYDLLKARLDKEDLSE